MKCVGKGWFISIRIGLDRQRSYGSFPEW
jgi:hypothetical protein